MGKHVHKLSELNAEARTAICANCGPVRISSGGLYKGRTRWRCTIVKKDFDNTEARKTYHQQYAKDYYERTGGHAQHKSWIKQYGLTPEDYARMLEEQNGVCAICKKECPTGQRLSVDHCHDTGKVRGLLCRNCNRGLGSFKDDRNAVLAALLYLNRQQA